MRASISGAHGRRRLRLPWIRAASCLIAAPLAACDYPTELPQLESRWVLPGTDTRFGVDDLLPADVELTPSGDAFLVHFDPVAFDETLGGLCPPCIALNGLTVPKPLILDSFGATIAFPAEVTSIELLSGDARIELQNGLGFDPIRPAAGVFGEITVTLTDDADGEVLATVTIDGAATAFPSGTTLNRTASLGAATIEGSVLARVFVDSPPGDPVTIDISNQVAATVVLDNVVVTSVTILVDGTVVSLDPVALDVADIDESIEDNIVDGALVLEVANPFGVGADVQVTIAGSGFAPIQKAATVGPEPESTIIIPMTAEEFQTFLGEESVTLTGTATVDQAAPPIAVLPGQELVIIANLDITLLLSDD